MDRTKKELQQRQVYAPDCPNLGFVAGLVANVIRGKIRLAIIAPDCLNIEPPRRGGEGIVVEPILFWMRGYAGVSEGGCYDFFNVAKFWKGGDQQEAPTPA